MKETFHGLSLDSEEDLIEAIKNFFKEMQHQFLENIFNNWIDRLHKCISAFGDYIEKNFNNILKYLIFIISII